MNLSNPKEEFSDAEGINCIGERRSKARSFETKIGGWLFLRYYFGLFQLI